MAEAEAVAMMAEVVVVVMAEVEVVVMAVVEVVVMALGKCRPAWRVRVPSVQFV